MACLDFSECSYTCLSAIRTSILSDHCMIKTNDSSIFIIGGFRNGYPSNKTFMVDPNKDFQIWEGPSLIEARYMWNFEYQKNP